MTPSTLTQLVILVLFVLPGSVYQAVRARLAGEVAANRDLTNRVLRALAASVVLDSLYGFVLGPWLVRLFGSRKAGTVRPIGQRFLDQVRIGSLLGLVLLFAIPAGLAYFAARRYVIGERLARIRAHGVLGTSWGLPRARLRTLINAGLERLARRCELHGGLRFDPTPTAWDWAVDHGGSGEGYVRVLGSSGEWHGGLYRGSSYFSSYPDSPAIYVQEAWQLDGNGEFIAAQEQSRGAWIPCAGATTVEFLGTTPDTGDNG